MKTPRTLLAAALLAAAVSPAMAQEYVRTTPAFAPNGNSNNPWSSLAVGIWATPASVVLNLNSNTYYEPGIINPGRSLFIKTVGGSSFIAPRPVTKTSLRIASYNTHLFGNDLIPGLPRWKDDSRAPHIGRVAVAEGADIFLLQEVWDPALFGAIKNTSDSYYTSGFYGGDHEGTSVLNSGLFTISRYQLAFPAQAFYEDEDGFFESMASKGYIRTTFTKNGFTITVFNTHTQSGSSSDSATTRARQMGQLSAAISIWRATHPDHIVILGGDFNALDTSAEFSQVMELGFGQYNDMGDGASNVPVAGNAHDCTTCYENDLRRYFDADNHSDWRIDYILYAPPLDGSARVLPKAYNVRKYEIPAGYGTICDDGICTRDLSDHFGISLDLELQRP